MKAIDNRLYSRNGYPLPIKRLGTDCRVSISLKTRCPRGALRLAKALEYHSVILLTAMDLAFQQYAAH